MAKPAKPFIGSGPNKLQEFGVRNQDIGFAIGVVAILLMLFVPLPSFLLDLGLAISLTLSIMVLMVALWIPKPIEFNSFPTVLLVVTMLRLSLNVSSTRLILSEGHTGTSAAGGVIEGFARFIVGGDFVIGIVIFAILVIINFMVITKGSTRIAEVAARFTLDAIPGKQMAIDADLGAGAIDDAEARRRRKELEEESSFYGAMDGASKFVRGDAVAGIIITLINVVGGIIIGVIQHDLSVGQAANNYTVLTIGDGLVSQIPALIISLAAGLIVTKGGTKGATNEAVVRQLGAFPRAMYVSAVLLLGIGLLPGFPFLVFASLAGGIIFLARSLEKQAKQKAAEEANKADADNYGKAMADETPQEILKLDDIRLELGSGLVTLISSMDAALPGKVRKLRELFAKVFGFILPPVRIKDQAHLPTNSYAILIRGVEVARGEIRPNLMMAIAPKGDNIQLAGERVKEPTFGLQAVWIDPMLTENGERLGYTIVDPESVITTHLTETIKEYMPSLLTFGATQSLVDGLDREYQKLAQNISSSSPVVVLQRILQTLLSERVSIRDLPLIIEAAVEAATQTQNVVMMVEHVRHRLSNQICQSLTDEEGYVPVIVLDRKWENEFLSNLKVVGDERHLAMEPQRVQEFIQDVRAVIQPFANMDEYPSILVNPEFRSFVRSMLDRVAPWTAIIGHGEIHRKASLKTVGTISRG
jgi:flagellar biosynthesis protein FlhA